MNTESAYCTFRVDSLHFGVEVMRVQEVLREQQITRVPSSSPIVRGLMNLRGQIVTALDLRRRLGLPDRLSTRTESDPFFVQSLPGRTSDQPSMNVVIQTSDGPVSLLVDEIGDVVQIESSRFELPPETLQGLPRELIRGVYKLDDQLLMVLNLESTLKISTKSAPPLLAN